jgi:hypothetical protein
MPSKGLKKQQQITYHKTLYAKNINLHVHIILIKKHIKNTAL